ncbi:antitoxin [Pseudonocardia sp. RS010]|uniref:antitoxin n=1 Tax=Pseudonocardia sp. RS010 TaxID=3385979 RepID=UPI0039A1CF0F
MGFMDKAKEMLGQHDDKVDQGLDKGGEMAKDRFAGHDEQIDKGVDFLQERTGEGDTTAAQPSAPEGEQPPPPQQ